MRHPSSAKKQTQNPHKRTHWLGHGATLPQPSSTVNAGVPSQRNPKLYLAGLAKILRKYSRENYCPQKLVTPMKSCAYCGRENPDEAKHCRECGTAEFTVPSSPSVPAEPKIEAVATVPDPEPDVSLDDESVLCMSCLFPNRPEATWCKRCGAAIGPTTSLVPTDAIRMLGQFYRGAVHGRPKPLVLAGVWVLFLPGLVANSIVIFSVLDGAIGGGTGVIGFWLALGGGAICYTMLYRVTRNYFCA